MTSGLLVETPDAEESVFNGNLELRRSIAASALGRRVVTWKLGMVLRLERKCKYVKA